jgi:hypothetical protein
MDVFVLLNLIHAKKDYFHLGCIAVQMVGRHIGANLPHHMVWVEKTA